MFRSAFSLLSCSVALAALMASPLALANHHGDHAAHAAHSSQAATKAAPFTQAAADAKVFIISPADGATVPTTFTVKFGASGIDIVPAGVLQENSGHHHLLIDTDPLPDLTQPLPATDTIVHFGKAQTEAEITLTPGTHTLQLVLGNFAHAPHANPVLSEKITVTVKE